MTKIIIGQLTKWITRHRVQQNTHQATMEWAIGISLVIRSQRTKRLRNQRGKRRRSQRTRKHPNQPKDGRRTQSQHGTRPKSMIMKLLKRRRSVIFITHMMIANDDLTSQRNWNHESNLTCKNWHSMTWKLFLMNNKIWMAKV